METFNFVAAIYIKCNPKDYSVCLQKYVGLGSIHDDVLYEALQHMSVFLLPDHQLLSRSRLFVLLTEPIKGLWNIC